MELLLAVSVGAIPVSQQSQWIKALCCYRFRFHCIQRRLASSPKIPLKLQGVRSNELAHGGKGLLSLSVDVEDGMTLT